MQDRQKGTLIYNECDPHHIQIRSWGQQRTIQQGGDPLAGSVVGHPAYTEEPPCNPAEGRQKGNGETPTAHWASWACPSELLEMLLVPRRSLGLALLLYSFVEDTFTPERGSKKGYLLFFLYFSSCSIYLFNILDLDLHHRIDILSTRTAGRS